LLHDLEQYSNEKSSNLIKILLLFSI